MKIGNKYPLGDVKADCWQVEYKNILTSSATSVTISGLTGNIAEEYMLICKFVNDYAGSVTYLLRPNNDTGSNYGDQYMGGIDTSVVAGRTNSRTGLYLGACTGQNFISQTRLLLYAKSGHIRVGIVLPAEGVNGTTIYAMMSFGLSWTNAADEITSLVVFADQTDGLGVGTEIILYKKVDT